MKEGRKPGREVKEEDANEARKEGRRGKQGRMSTKGGEGRNVKEGEGRTDINEERKECEGGKEGCQQRNAKKTRVSVGAVLCCNHSPTSSHSTHTPHPKLDPPTDPPASATPRVSFPLSLYIQNASPLFPCTNLSLTHPYNACNHPVLLHPPLRQVHPRE